MNRELQWAAGGGFLAALLFASTLVAWRFGWDPGLGHPLVGHFYNPLSVWKWGWAWGLDPRFKQTFLSAMGMVAVVAVGPLMAIIFFVDRGRLKVGDRDPDEGLGTLRDLIKHGGMTEAGDGVVVGRLGRKVLRDPGDGHIMLSGPPRSDKGVSIIVPTCLLHSGSMVVVDPKGELARMTGRRRAEFGSVRVFNPLDVNGARFNPLLELGRGSDMIGSCQMAGHMLTHGHKEPSDPHWQDAAGEILGALLVHVCESTDATLVHMWRLVQGLRAGTFPNATHSHVIDTLAAHASRSERELTGVNSALGVSLQFLADPLIHATTSSSDFSAADLQCAERPLTVFISIAPARAEQLRPLTRLILASLLKPLLHEIDTTSDGQAKRRAVLVLVDEFPALGRMDILEFAMAQSAGYGVRFLLACQDPAQIEAIYGNHQSITSYCATQLMIPGFSADALKAASSWAGDHAVVHSSKQVGLDSRGTLSKSSSEARIPILNPAEMIVRGKRDILVFTRGCLPTWVPRARYFEMSAFAGMADRAPVVGSAP